MAGYTHTTLSSARTALSLRLDDPDHVYWSAAELNLYIVEAIRTWQALTAYYRERTPLVTAADDSYINLAATGVVPAGVFDYNVTDRYLSSIILYQLLEAQLSGGWTWLGTEQFNLVQMIGAMTRRRNRFLGDSGCVVDEWLSPATSAPPIGRINISENIIDVRRAAWILGADEAYPLLRDDDFGITTAFPDFVQNPQDPPDFYSVSSVPPASIQIAPVPLNNGQLHLISVMNGAELDVATGVLLGVPDDFSWGVKWGVMADMLSSDGRGRDTERAAYCERRYREAVEVAKLNPSVLEAQLNNNPIFTSSMFDLDTSRSNWLNDRGQPDIIGFAGRNLFGLANTPDDIYGLTLDLVRNIPVPAADGDYLQIGKDMLDTLLDYAQHIACFKMGGNDFNRTMPLYQNFIKAAGLQNARIRQASFYNDALRIPGLKQLHDVPRVDVPRSAQYAITNSDK